MRLDYIFVDQNSCHSEQKAIHLITSLYPILPYKSKPNRHRYGASIQNNRFFTISSYSNPFQSFKWETCGHKKSASM